MRSLWILLLPVTGCFEPLDLPPFGGVPLEGRPYTPCAPESEDVRVACVIDGDTLDLDACGDDVGQRVRLLGIDAPETEKPGVPAECFANEAARFVAELLEGESITLSHDRTCTGAFGRTLGYLWLRGDALENALQNRDLEPWLWSWYLDSEEPAILLNEALLGLGMVRDYPEEIAGTLVFQARLDQARQQAEVAGRGLWGACEGQP